MKSLLVGFRFHTATDLLRNYHWLCFRIESKKNSHNYLKRLIKYSSLFQLCIYKTGFSSYISTKNISNRLSSEADMRIHMYLFYLFCFIHIYSIYSIKQNIKQICKILNNATLLASCFYILKNVVIFYKNMLSILTNNGHCCHFKINLEIFLNCLYFPF